MRTKRVETIKPRRVVDTQGFTVIEIVSGFNRRTCREGDKRGDSTLFALPGHLEL